MPSARPSDRSLSPAHRKGRAAEYVRMSTEHQQYSTENQREVIRQYARQRGMIVVRTYADEGKNGLRIDGRDALKQLIEDVENGGADFADILVYDVSAGDVFRMRTRVPITSTSADERRLPCTIAPSNLKTTGVRYQPSSKA
jgi:hypothetical protein